MDQDKERLLVDLQRHYGQTLTVAQVADLAGVDSWTVRKWAREGLLAGEMEHRRGGYLFPASAVAELLHIKRRTSQALNTLGASMTSSAWMNDRVLRSLPLATRALWLELKCLSDVDGIVVSPVDSDVALSVWDVAEVCNATPTEVAQAVDDLMRCGRVLVDDTGMLRTVEASNAAPYEGSPNFELAL